MSRRRLHRRVEKVRRHTPPPPPDEAARATRPPNPTPTPRVVVRKAPYVERLAYTRTQAAEALGISRSTLRRLLPYIETIEMPWGARLIPVDELERVSAERRQAAQARHGPRIRGRPSAAPRAVVERIHADRVAGKTLGQIAADLNADGTPTAHGGTRWWPSSVRAILQRRESHE